MERTRNNLGSNAGHGRDPSCTHCLEAGTASTAAVCGLATASTRKDARRKRRCRRMAHCQLVELRHVDLVYVQRLSVQRLEDPHTPNPTMVDSVDQPNKHAMHCVHEAI
jgi:hypothetical protein